MRKTIFWVFVGVLLLLFVAGVNMSGGASAPAATNSTAVRYVTIDGSDGVGGVIDPLNLWNDYDTRAAVVGHVRPNEQVQLVETRGDGVLVQTSVGVRGWISRQFIKELE